ncbi:MAG: hypothetical protein ACLU62_08015 [Hydrogeniiclostridium sp.]
MEKRKGQKLFLCLSILLLTIAAAHIFFPQLNNWKLKLSGKDSSYLQLRPLKGTVLSQEINAAEDYTGEAYPVGSSTDTALFIPNKTIHYYASPGDIQPAYTVHAGKSYVHTFFWGYGFTSWPTYSKEWRYVQPFQTYSDVQNSYDKLHALPYYYVRYSDLLALSEENEGDMLYYDQWLYKLGLYYSPNLPLFLDIWNISFLAAGLLLLAITLFWTCKSLKR